MIDPDDCTTIDEVRAAIDTIDRRILADLGLRQQYVHAVTQFKATAEDARADDRFAAVIASRRAWAEQEGVDPDLVERLYRDLIAHFIAVELTELGLQ